MRKSNITKTVLFGLILLAAQSSGVKAGESATLQEGAEVRVTVTREFDGEQHTQTMKGTLVGALVGPGERWEDVSEDNLQLGLGSMPNGKTGFIIARRF